MYKYLPLENYLKGLKVDAITLTFQEIEKILKSKLPSSAYQYPQWWENDKSHVQSQAWLNAAYKTINSSIAPANSRIGFIKNKF